MRLRWIPGKPRPTTVLTGFVALLTLAFVIYLPLGAVQLWRAVTTRAAAHRLADLPHPGRPVRDGALAFTVGSMSCGATSAGGVASVHGQFCAVRLTVRNDGSTPIVFPAAAQRATGSEGGFYLPSPQADAGVNGRSDSIGPADLAGSLPGDPPMGEGGPPPVDPLAPGATLTTTLEYDVPAGVAITEVTLRQSMYSRGVTVVP